MTTYAIELPDEIVLTAIHRFAPSNESAPPRWSISVQPHPDSDVAYFASGHGVHPELQPAADEAVANLCKNLADIEPWILRNREAKKQLEQITSLELDL